MLDEPVRSAPSAGSSARQAISPVPVWYASAWSIVRSTIGQCARRKPVSPVQRWWCQIPVAT